MPRRSCGFSAPVRAAFAASLVLLALAAPCGARGGEVPSGAVTDTLLLPAHELESGPLAKKIRVGDTLQFTVRGADPALKAQLPPGAPAEAAEGWALVPADTALSAAVSPVPGAPVELRLSIVLTRPGDLKIPSLVLVDPSGKAVARTNPWSLPGGAQVASVLDPQDPKAQEPVPAIPPLHLRFPIWLAVVLVVLALGAIAGAVYAAILWNRRRPKKVEPEKKEIPLPEDEAALKALSELEKTPHLRRGEYKKFYFALSEILKAYLGARYRFDAPESTSREIIAVLEERKSVSDGVLDRLETLLQLLDRVKFTDHAPEQGEPERLLAESRELVLGTRRPPRPAETEQGGTRAVR